MREAIISEASMTYKPSRPPQDLCNRKRDPVRVYYNALTPPIGTNYWKRIPISIAENSSFESSTMSATRTWRAEAYVYVSNAAPNDPQFTAKGGAITVVILHQGYYTDIEAPISSYPMFPHTITSSIPPLDIIQLPPSDSGKTVCNRTQYNINYKESLPMFRNGGNETFVFSPEFLNDFVLTNARQTGAEIRNGLQFSMSKSQTYEGLPELPIHAMSAFRFNDAKQFPVTFEFKMSPNTSSHEIHPPEPVHGSMKVDLVFP